MVRLRLKRMGRHKRPFYRLNAVEKHTQRDGKVLENLGWYDPVARDESKQVSLKEERIKHWLGKGAQPSDTVENLLAKHGLVDAEVVKAKRERRIARKRKAIVEAKQASEAAAKAEAEAAAKAEAEAKAKAEAEAEAAAAEAAEAPAEGGDDASES